VPPRHLAARVGGSRNLFFEVSPNGCVKQAWKISGMNRLRR
jgi:hypothetical protein